MDDFYTINTSSDVETIKQAKNEMWGLYDADYETTFDYEVEFRDDYIVVIASIYLNDGDFWPMLEIRFAKAMGIEAIDDFFDFHVSHYFQSTYKGKFKSEIEPYFL